MPLIDRFDFAGVEGLRVGRFSWKINTSCILYRLGGTVVDTGPPNQWRAVRRFLRERAVERVAVTHHHEDHSGNLAPIRRELAAEVLAPGAGIRPLAEGYDFHPYRYLIWGRPGRVEAEALPDRVPLGGGRRLEPIAAPGHSPDMTCFLEPERGWLFTGDLYISARTHYLRADENLGDQIASLRKVLGYDFDTLFCSHRGVVESGKEALRRKLDFLESLVERVGDLHREGRGAREITRLLLGREDLMSLLTLFHFCKGNLVAAAIELSKRPAPAPAES